MSNRLTKLLATSLLVFAVVLTGCEQPTEVTEDQLSKEEKAEQILNRNGQTINGEYIVVFKDLKEKNLSKASRAKRNDERIRQIVTDNNIKASDILSTYKYSLGGFSAKLTPQQVGDLAGDDRVEYIEENKIVILSPPKATNSFWCIFFGIGCDYGGGDPQVTPYGITRVGGAVNGAGLRAWVIDTGIDLDHNDLNVDTQMSTSFVTSESTADDGNGHGTHVAGTIAAIDNGIDVVGVAAGATVVAVKVLSGSGSGTTAGVIDGVDYVTANASSGDVANMSLGGGTSTALDAAVRNAADQGIMFALAAGNDGADANNSSPARVEYPNVWTVSAIDSNDNFASFSNYGNPPIEYAAPGVSIKSLWKQGGVNTISGTSMASPHVAGVLLVTGGNPTSDGTANGDPDGTADPIVHQ